MVEDLTKASDIVSAAVDAGGTGVRLNGLRLQVGDPEAALEPARTDAIEQARAKAEEYAADTGHELGEVVKVSEVADQPYRRRARPTAPSARGLRASDPDPGRPAGPDRLGVVVVFELR